MRNWSYDVNSIIQHLRLPENVFENFVACDILNVKHKTFLLMEEEWKWDISNKPKWRKYIKLLNQITFPLYYLNLIEVFLLNFAVEFHLWDSKQAVDRELEMRQLDRHALWNWKSVSVQDDYHFLLKCNVFSDIRVDYINNIMHINADFINFNLEQKITFYITKCWREALIFLCKAWSKRQICLYL